MILGMSLQTFTLVHVLISLAGIVSGFVVMYGLLTNKREDGWTAVFLITTVLASLTGFLFPFFPAAFILSPRAETTSRRPGTKLS